VNRILTFIVRTLISPLRTSSKLSESEARDPQRTRTALSTKYTYCLHVQHSGALAIGHYTLDVFSHYNVHHHTHHDDFEVHQLLHALAHGDGRPEPEIEWGKRKLDLRCGWIIKGSSSGKVVERRSWIFSSSPPFCINRIAFAALNRYINTDRRLPTYYREYDIFGCQAIGRYRRSIVGADREELDQVIRESPRTLAHSLYLVLTGRSRLYTSAKSAYRLPSTRNTPSCPDHQLPASPLSIPTRGRCKSSP
jgi:hypothetical protein